MTREELIKAWVAYRGEANVTSDQVKALDFAWKMYWEQNFSVTDIENEYKRLLKMDEKKIDWEQRRYEIAKDVLCAWYASGRTDGLEMDINDAVRTADELIKRLKSHKHNDN